MMSLASVRVADTGFEIYSTMSGRFVGSHVDGRPIGVIIPRIDVDTRQEPNLCKGCKFDGKVCPKHENGICHEQNHYERKANVQARSK